jgi:hypothetical protein
VNHEVQSMKEMKESGYAAIVAATLLLPLGYVLSVGPAGWLANHDYISVATWDAIYYPVVWASNKADWSRDVLRWYTNLGSSLPDS